MMIYEKAANVRLHIFEDIEQLLNILNISKHHLFYSCK